MVIGKIDPPPLNCKKEQAASSVEALGQNQRRFAPGERARIPDRTQKGRWPWMKNNCGCCKRTAAFSEAGGRRRGARQTASMTSTARWMCLKKDQGGKTQLSVLQSQVNAQRRQVAIQNRGILSEKDPMEKK